MRCERRERLEVIQTFPQDVSAAVVGLRVVSRAMGSWIITLSLPHLTSPVSPIVLNANLTTDPALISLAIAHTVQTVLAASVAYASGCCSEQLI